MNETKIIVKPSGGIEYPVVVGRSLLDTVAQYIPKGVAKIAVITQQEIPYELKFDGYESQVFIAPSGETAKKLSTVETLLEEISSFGLSRRDLIVCMGGGVVTDLGGFVASVYFRGIRYINVATTLLAQVDAAIGGKTGVNLAHGKNLAGTFWQPSAVLCDIDTLETLPERELRCGYGEMAKYDFLGVGELSGLDLVTDVSHCATIKARIVSMDVRENGQRALLNYGHTLAHALEGLALEGKIDYLYHGEAVAIGLVYAAHLAHLLGRIDQFELDYHYQVLDKFALSSSLPRDATFVSLLPYLYRDKKAYGSLTFVLGSSERGLEVVDGILEGQVNGALDKMRDHQRRF